MRAASTAATAQAMACSRMRSASTSRRSASSSFESRRPRIRYAGSRIPAAATTGPNSDPRPTSSTPATSCAPAAHARFSNLRVHRSFFSKRNLAAEAEIPSALEVFAVRTDFEAGLDTDADQHLRRRSGAKQEQMFDECVEAGLPPRMDGAEPRHHTTRNRRLLLFDFFQTCGLALESAQVVKFRAPDFGGAHHVNLVDDLGVDGEDALHALAETDFADRKARLRAPLSGNDDAFERLQALFFAFSDLDQNLDRIAGAKLGNVGAARFRQQFFDNRIAHNVSFLILSV